MWYPPRSRYEWSHPSPYQPECLKGINQSLTIPFSIAPEVNTKLHLIYEVDNKIGPAPKPNPQSKPLTQAPLTEATYKAETPISDGVFFDKPCLESTLGGTLSNAGFLATENIGPIPNFRLKAHILSQSVVPFTYGKNVAYKVAKLEIEYSLYRYNLGELVWMKNIETSHAYGGTPETDSGAYETVIRSNMEELLRQLDAFEKQV